MQRTGNVGILLPSQNMDADQRLSAALGFTKARKFRQTELEPSAPAPRLQKMAETNGQELTTRAVEAWGARLSGTPVIDIAHSMGIGLEAAKALLKDAHAALREDLKEQLDLNRNLDLGRIDGLIQTYYPQARGGDIDCAQVVLKCLQHRAKLTGIEPPPDARSNNQPQNVLVWIQNQLPSINKIVDALPLE